MTDLLNVIAKTISAPFSAFFPKTYPYTENGVKYTSPAPQPRQINISQNQARSQPHQRLTPSQEIDSIQAEMGLPPLNLADNESVLYLPKSRVALEEYRSKKQIDAQGYAKYNTGIQQAEQKHQQKEQSAWNFYDNEQNRRIANSTQLRQEHDAREAPYINYMNQVQDIQNKMSPPPFPIKFG